MLSVPLRSMRPLQFHTTYTKQLATVRHLLKGKGEGRQRNLRRRNQPIRLSKRFQKQKERTTVLKSLQPILLTNSR